MTKDPERTHITDETSRDARFASEKRGSPISHCMSELNLNIFVLCIVAVTQGFISFPNLSIQYFFKDTLNLDPAALALFNSIINFVWILKPIFGFITDSCPCFGFRRRPYLFFFSLSCSASWVLLSFVVNSLPLAILVKILINISISFTNIVGEALMVEASAA